MLWKSDVGLMQSPFRLVQGNMIMNWLTWTGNKLGIQFGRGTHKLSICDSAGVEINLKRADAQHMLLVYYITYSYLYSTYV